MHSFSPSFSPEVVSKQSYSVEPAQELQSKLRLEEMRLASELSEKALAGKHQRFLEKAKTIALIISILSLGVVCLLIGFSSKFQQEEKKRAIDLVQSIAVGIVSYIAGKSANKQSPS